MTHHINVTIDDDLVTGKITCSAEVGALCRLTCPEDCEEFTLEGHQHQLVDSGECMHLTFIDNDEASIWELYTGEPGPLRSGLVKTSYSDYQVTWDYVPPTDPGFGEPAKAEPATVSQLALVLGDHSFADIDGQGRAVCTCDWVGPVNGGEEWQEFSRHQAEAVAHLAAQPATGTVEWGWAAEGAAPALAWPEQQARFAASATAKRLMRRTVSEWVEVPNV